MIRRDSRWHRRHLKRLAKNKARHKKDRASKLALDPYAELQFQKAQERERQKKAISIFARRWWIKLTNLKLVATVRGWIEERQYRGTK